jgi:endo-1,4-beta-xylanase
MGKLVNWKLSSRALNRPLNRLSASTFIFTICVSIFGTAGSLAGADPATLRDAAGHRLQIGVAITSAQIKDPATAKLIVRQFDCLTAEYEFMPQFLEPEPGKFTFERADRIAAFAAAHHLPLTGHMLCWNQLTPAWMFEDAKGKPLSRPAALAHLKQHIDGVVAHFHGKVDSWNVVNEAISDQPGEDLRDTPARRAIGNDYIERAFEYARAADPGVPLYYNDYNIEDPKKLPRTLRLIQRLKENGQHIDAVGIQGHWLLDYPAASTIDAAITALNRAGVTVMITELDVDVLPRQAVADLNAVQSHGENPYPHGLPAEILQKQADRYAALFRVFMSHPGVVTRVTFWGVDDGQSWLNNFPVKGRKNYPLLFDRQLHPKPAFQAVVDVLSGR